jgi:hypothetical protein
MGKKIIFNLFLLFNVICLLNSQSVSTVCHTSGIWGLFDVPKTLLQPFLPQGVDFDIHPYIISDSNHPLYLEFNIQHDCVAYGFIPAPRMHEFKVEIPFTKTEKVRNVMYKPLVIEDSLINVLGSKYAYGLPTLWGTFSGDFNNTYEFSHADQSIKAKFIRKENTWKSNLTQNLNQSYVFINERPWFCNERDFIIGQEKCAMDYYGWNKPGFAYTPVEIQVEFNGKYINGTLHTKGIDEQVLGGVHVEVELDISNRYSC